MDGNQDEPKSLLNDLRPHHVVAVHNPLTTDSQNNLQGDFTWQVARSVVQDDPATRDPHISTMRLRNDSHPTMKHVTQKITIPSGKTMNLPGDVAKVVVEHLVDEMMYRRGQKNTIGDPVQRRECEELVVQNINDLRKQLSSQSIEEQLNQQIRDLNKEEASERTHDAADEQAFPGLQPEQRAAETVPAGGAVATGNPVAPGQKATAVK